MSHFRNFSRHAAEDLDNIIGWMLDHGGCVRTAPNDSSGRGQQIAEWPLRGRRRPDLLPDPYRFWSIPRHRLLMVYDPTTNPATILRVLNTARDLPPLLADLRNPLDAPEG
jgi:plasmid stabilization system protein ParE